MNECTDLKNALLYPGKQFSIAESKIVVDDIYENCCIDTNDRFHNTFFYEICPLLLIAGRVGNEETRIVFLGRGSRFDGLLLLNRRRQQKVELTAAVDGHQEALRMELLAKRGHAPAFQKIEASGNRRNRTFGQNENRGGFADEYDHGTLMPLLENALELKINKARTNQDYVGAWLGLVFDDWICPRGETEKRKRFDPLCRRLLGNDPDRYAPFSRVFIVGISRGYLFDTCETWATRH